MRSITVDDMIVDAAGAGIRARGKARESLTADALVPVLIVGVIGVSAASLEGFTMSGRDICFSLADSRSVAGRVPIVSMACA